MAHSNNGRRQIVVVEAPSHPVSQLQGPFEESMFESQSSSADEIEIPVDASTRRNMLLEAPTYHRVIAGRWKQKAGEKFHPLWKLVAQMSFGIHLLSESMAKSEEDVFQILQTHVDDIDIFLERTTEDFTLAQDDIQERLKCLRLPLQHPDVFERMLEDRTFRNSIVDGNEKIEHIVNRTGCAMKDALKDVQKGFDSTNCLEKYLSGLEATWVRRSQEHEAVFVAMLGNVDGWKTAFLDLHMQGNKLAGSLRKLTDVVNQMQQKAGEVSRRLIKQQQRQGGAVSGTNSFTYHSRQQSLTRSSSRQQETPTSQGRKNSQTSTSQTIGAVRSGRNSREAHASDASQVERSGTGLSMRSAEGRANTPSSRATSRTATPSAPRDSGRTNVGTPRLVFVKNQTGHHRTNSHSASQRDNEHRVDSALSNRSETPQHQLRPQESTISVLEQPTPTVIEPKAFAPVELPAEIPPEAFLQAPLSNKNRLSTGLGFLPSERRAQAATASNAFNPATALVELLRDPSRYSKLPLSASTTASPVLPSHTLSALEGKKHLTIDSKQASRSISSSDQVSGLGDETSSEGTPLTPAWASQVVDDAERSRILAEKIPFSTRTPVIGAGATPAGTKKVEGSAPAQTMLGMSVKGSKAGSGELLNSASYAPSELSAGYEDEMPKLTRQQAEAAMTINTPEINGNGKKKLSFIAELEGSEPVFLPSTVYTPISVVANAATTHELEASESYFALPQVTRDSDSVSGRTSNMSNAGQEAQKFEPSMGIKEGMNDDEIQIVLEEAIRVSASDAQEDLATENTPAFKSPHEDLVSELPDQTTPRPPATRPRSPMNLPAIAEESQSTTPSADTQGGISELSDKRATTIHIPDAPTRAAPPVPIATTAQAPADANPLSLTSPVVATIDSASADETIPIPLVPSVSAAPVTPSTAIVTAINTPEVSATDADDVVAESETRKPGDRSEGLAKAIENVKKNFRQSRRISISTPTDNVDPSGSASAPNTITKTSPRSSVGAHSPASLISVHSAPATELQRSNTRETRKQWKAFFSGQLKSPRSPATSSTSIKSTKSPTISITSSHRHTNSQASQTNASINTIWLSSPVIPETASIDGSSNLQTNISELESKGPAPVAVPNPLRLELRQHSSPTLGFHETSVGLGLLASPAEASPTSPSPSSIVATATASTAIQARKINVDSGTAARAVTPASIATFVSVPKLRVIEVRRKAVGSGAGAGAGGSSRSTSAASNTTSSDIVEGSEERKSKLSIQTAGSRSTSPMPKVAEEVVRDVNKGELLKSQPVVHVVTESGGQLVADTQGQADDKIDVRVQETTVIVPTVPNDSSTNPEKGMAVAIQEREFSEQRLAEDDHYTKSHERESSGDSNFDILDAYS